MSKIVFIKENSKEIRNKLKQSGFSICVCAAFPDSIWLDYHPDLDLPFDIHGVGYSDSDDPDFKLPPLERIQDRFNRKNWYSEDREFYNTVNEFLEVYGNKKCKSNT